MKQIVTTEKEKAESVASSIRDNYGDEVKISVINSRHFPKDVPDFVFLFQKVGLDVSKKLTPASCKVLLYMISSMQYSTHIGCDQKTLAEQLDLSLRSVSGAIKELKEMNIILSYPDPQDRKRNVYMINPHSAWKGSIHKRKKYIKTIDQAQLEIKF